jgi:hypothetical protein
MYAAGMAGSAGAKSSTSELPRIAAGRYVLTPRLGTSATTRSAGTGACGLPLASVSSMPLNAVTVASIGSGSVGRASAVALPVPTIDFAGQAEGP